MNTKRFTHITIGIMFLGLMVFALPTIIIDPYFHYHAPLKDLEYPINNQRYQNDGMLKHFSYDSIIIGSSMMENFKADEFDELFGANSLHVSFSGGSYKEINNNLITGLEHNPNVRFVLRGLDLTFMDKEKDYMKYESYPDYLYDSNPFNDVQYIWNKSVFDLNWEVLEYTEQINDSSFVSEEKNNNYSKEIVLASFERVSISKEQAEFTEEGRNRILENVQQNVTSTVEEYPNVTFYFFIPPYNICYWDEVFRSGNLDYMLEGEKIMIEEILKYDNIKLFSFSDNFELICNLDVYKDQGHYSPDINSKILKWIKNGEYELTQDNYREHIEKRRLFYKMYDYNSIFQQ